MENVLVAITARNWYLDNKRQEVEDAWKKFLADYKDAFTMMGAYHGYSTTMQAIVPVEVFLAAQIRDEHMRPKEWAWVADNFEMTLVRMIATGTSVDYTKVGQKGYPQGPNERNFNQRVEVHMPGHALSTYNETMLLEDSCTDALQTALNKGWRIIACCPQPDSRRPDYILGRYNPEQDARADQYGYWGARRVHNLNEEQAKPGEPSTKTVDLYNSPVADEPYKASQNIPISDVVQVTVGPVVAASASTMEGAIFAAVPTAEPVVSSPLPPYPTADEIPDEDLPIAKFL